jgi:hypothetical protein
MPRMPVYTQQTTADGPGLAANASGVRVVGVGEGLERFGRALEQVGNKVQAERDELAIMEADRALNEWETSTLYDPEKGMLTRNGKAAQGASVEARTAFKQQVDTLGAKLGPRAAAQFRKLAATREQDIVRTLSRHELNQLASYSDAETKAYIQGSVEAAANNYTDPERTEGELIRQRAAIVTNAERLGLPPAVMQQQLEAAHSATRAAVIDRMLATGDYAGAETYYGKHADQIDGEQHARLQESIRRGTLRGKSQETADQLVTGGRVAALKAARAIDDPEMRDAVENRVSSHFAERDRIEAEAEKSVRESAWQAVESAGTLDVLTPQQLAVLSRDGYTLNQMENRMDAKRAGRAPKSDPATIDRLQRLAYQDAAGFMAYDLTKDYGTLDFQARQQFGNLQAAIKKDGATADAVVRLRTTNQMADDRLRNQLKIDVGEKASAREKDIALQFRTRFQQELVAKQLETGRKPNALEEAEILDRMTIEGRATDWFGTSTRAFQAGSDPDWRAAEVPAADRAEIVDALKRRGNKKPTEEQIAALYARSLGAPVGE